MAPNLSPAPKDQRRVRVLIVDDAPQVRRDLHQFLELIADTEVIAEAEDGQQAVELAAELAPDVVLMDLEMPGMDGFEATRQIKAQLPAARVVILSMYAGPENMLLARSAGADEFVEKGAIAEVLIRAILEHANPSDPNSSQKGSST